MWPAVHHEQVFARDELLHLIDAAVYTSELPVGKPHELAFRTVLGKLGIPAEDAVYVGDRLLEDVAGPQRIGMRAIWLPNSSVADESGQIVPDAVIERLGQVLDVVLSWS